VYFVQWQAMTNTHTSTNPVTAVASPAIQAIAVYCGSALGINPAYAELAQSVGTGLAQRGITLVYGAGLMGEVANAALAAGGTVVGIIPDRLVSKEAAHKGLSELIIVPDMHIRKAMMMSKADAFISLPGGVGTLEELFEVWTWLQLGYHRKPVGLLNVAGYYDPLLAMMQHTVAQGFLRAENNAQMLVDTDLDGLLTQMHRFTPMDSDAWLRNKY
jgi:uncharacterized protein (TIGR00730 family)